MNTPAVKSALGTCIYELVSAGNVVAPRDSTRLVELCAALIEAAETEAIQHAKDIAQANGIASQLSDTADEKQITEK